jgi:hypothetical protein
VVQSDGSEMGVGPAMLAHPPITAAYAALEELAYAGDRGVGA